MERKDFASDVYSFEDLIDGNFLYVDKTEYLWNLVKRSKGTYFLSRPRRFGKSLTISTLKAIFEGREELFQGLAISRKGYKWKKYPVIHLDLNGRKFDSPEDVETSLREILQRVAKLHGFSLQTKDSASMFQDLLDCFHPVGPAVVLVDEYDKPILRNLDNGHAESVLRIMQNFYSVIKARSEDIRFTFITGVTKICHVSLFSGFNTPTDLSMEPDYATMLGYTQEELEANFGEYLGEKETLLKLPHDEFMAQLKNWYDGFRFAEGAATVYNPVSVAKFLVSKLGFANYWFKTGTPSLLPASFKNRVLDWKNILEKPVSPSFFDAFELDKMNAQTILYQAGYLTIDQTLQVSEYRDEMPQTYYKLRFPNYEVRSSFYDQLLPTAVNVDEQQAKETLGALVSTVDAGDVPGFIAQLKSFFAAIPFDLKQGKQELNYEAVVYVLYYTLNRRIRAEYHTNEGSIDLVLEAGNWIYVIELKVNKTAKAAMKQIRNKDYAAGFLATGKHVVALGINFSQKKGQITDYLHEQLC